MQILLGKIIQLIHILFLIYVIVTPFIEVSIDFRILYFWTLLSTIVHWIANDTTCFLTILEKKLMGKTDDQSFIYKLVSPVYDLSKYISDKTFREYMQYLALLLFFINLYKLKKQIGNKSLLKTVIYYDYIKMIIKK